MTDASKRGRFIVLDGVDGCGKTTQAKRLVARLEAQGESVLHLREPGSTELGERLRELLLHSSSKLSPRVETLLFCAARRQMLDEIVSDALAQGSWVVCERFNASTFAYQAVAGELDEAEIVALLDGWVGDPRPDLTLVLTLEAELARTRRGADRDRIERKAADYHERVAQGYERYAQGRSDVACVAADGSADDVEQAVWREVSRVQ